MGSKPNPRLFPPVLENIIGIGILSKWQNLHTGSLTHDEGYYGSKNQVEASRTASPSQNNKPKAIHIERLEINVT